MHFDKERLDELFGEEVGSKSDARPKPVKSRKTAVTVSRSTAAATVYDWLGSLFKMMAIFLLLATFVFRVARVEGHSMETTLIDTDKLIVTDLFYTPHNGDIVIISHGEQLNEPLVKRVIAVSGQEIFLDYSTYSVYVDGKKLDEPYIQGVTVNGDVPVEELNGVVPEGKVFVMGDNREHSSDSRSHSVGLIDTDSIIGKVQLDIIPHKYENGRLVLDLSAIRYVYAQEESAAD